MASPICGADALLRGLAAAIRAARSGRPKQESKRPKRHRGTEKQDKGENWRRSDKRSAVRLNQKGHISRA